MNKARRKKWLTKAYYLLVVLALYLGIGRCLEVNATSGFVIRNSPPDTSNKYYYNSNYNVNAGGQYAMPNCTTYVLGRIYEITGKKCELSGNAKDYFVNNKNKGTYAYSTDQYSPALGAIICFTNDADGHVAVVEEIGTDSGGKYICVSESNYSGRNSGKETKRFNYVKYYLSDLDGFTSSNSKYSIRMKYLEDNDGYAEEYDGQTIYIYPFTFQGYIYCDKEGSIENIDNTRVIDAGVTEITDTTAKINAKVSPYGTVTECGFYIGTSPDNMKKVVESGTVKDCASIFYTLGTGKWTSALSKGTTYYYQIYGVIGGVTYKTAVGSFTTTGDSVQPVIESVKVTNLSSEGYNVQIVATDNMGISKVSCPTWTMNNDQDDLVDEWWNNAIATHVSGNTYVYRVNISEHNNERGIYITHVYAYDKSGNTAFNSGILLEVPEPTIPVTGISLDNYRLSLVEGGTSKLIATITPSNATNKTVTWRSDNTNVATVNNGLVTAIAPGKAMITVTNAGGGYSASCSVTVECSHSNSLGYIYKSTKEPTTSATGTLTGTCSKCGGTTTVTLPKLTTADYDYTIKKAAGCTTNGTGRYTWKTTTYGSFYFNVTLPAAGHSYSYKVTKEPTTSETGTLTGTCNKCGGTTTITLPKLTTADYDYKIQKTAGCTTSGTGRYTWKTTTYGSYYFDVTLPATGHSYSYKVTIEPTTSATGTLTSTCNKCGGTTTITLPKLTKADYNYTIHKAASCTTSGTGRYTWKSTTYGIFYFDVAIPATGHSYGYKLTKEPTTSATGTLTGTCSKCGGTTTVTLPKLTTANYDYTIMKEAGCKTDGTGRYTWKTTTYGSFYFDVTLPATGHNYSNGSCTHCGMSDPNYVINHLVTGIIIDKTLSLTLGETATIIATITPENATNKELMWSSSDTNIAIVSENGLVTAIGTGTTTITATAADGSGVSASCEVTVTAAIMFEDVVTGSYYEQPVQWAVENGITNGYGSDTIFNPEGTCTRGQIVTFLWRANGSPEPASLENPFTDVPSSEYYYKAVLWAVENGITAGYGSDTIFNPDGACTRAQVATFMWRAAGSPDMSNATNPFTDLDTEGFYYDAVLWAVENGITNGYGSADTFCPDITCTRGQIVTFLYRGMNSER